MKIEHIFSRLRHTLANFTANTLMPKDMTKFIGCRAIILGRVAIDNGVIVGSANMVGLVRDDIENNVIVGGVPAKILRHLPE